MEHSANNTMKLELGTAWIAVLLVGLAAVMAGCGGKQERLASHMEKGKAYYEQANYDKARIEVRNVLQIDPKNADAYFLSGLIDEEQQEWQRAFRNYTKAVELNPEQIQAKVRLGRFNLLAGRLPETEAIMAEVLAKLPEDPGARFLRAGLMVRKGETAAAIEEASSIVAANPTHTDTISLLAGLHARQGDDAKAVQVLEAGIKANPRNVAFQLDLAAIAARRNETARVEKAYLDIIAIEPRIMRHRVALANAYISTSQLDKAEKALRDAVQADPDDLQRHLLLVEFLATRRSPQDAEKELLSAVQAKPNAYPLRFSLGRLYELTGRPDHAEQTYRGIIGTAKARPERIKAKVLLAQNKLASGDAAEAEKLVAEVLAENQADSDALRIRAQMALAKGDAKQSVPDLRVVLRDHPEAIEVMNLLASAHMANNDPQLAKDVYNNAIVRYPSNANFRVALANFLVARGDYDGALKELDTALKADPGNVRAFQLKADIQVARKDWAAAEKTSREFKTAFPSDAFGDFRLGTLYLTQNKLDQATAEYELALKKVPGAIEPLIGAVTVLLQQGKADQAVTRINQVIKAFPDNAPAYALLANVYAQQKKYARAEAALQKVTQIDRRAAAPYVGLANLAMMRGDATAAVNVLQQAAGVDLADPLRVSYALAETYLNAGDRNKAIAEYEKILERNPRADAAANNLAALLSETRGNKADLERALALAKRFENASNPAFLDTLGWVYFQLGDNERAPLLLQKAVTMAPKAPDLRYHLGMALYKKGDLKAAKTHLQLAVDSKVKFVGLEEASATLAKM